MFLFKGGDGEEDSLKSLTTLGSVLLLTVRLMAPFTPFFCDLLWQNLRYIVPNGADSVHFERIPEPRLDYFYHSLFHFSSPNIIF